MYRSMSFQKRFQTPYINSKNRDTNLGSEANFTVHFKNPIFVGSEGFDTLHVEQILVRRSFHNVRSVNNVIAFTDSVGDKTATLTNGNYTYATLAVEIAAVMTAASADTWNCAYSESLDVFTLGTTATGKIRGSDSNFTARKLLGWDNLDTSTGSGFTSIFSPAIEPENLMLKFYFDENYYTSIIGNLNNFSASIPVTSDAGKVIVYKPDTPYFVGTFEDNTNLSKIRVEIYDVDFETAVIDMRGGHTQLQLRFS